MYSLAALSFPSITIMVVVGPIFIIDIIPFRTDRGAARVGLPLLGRVRADVGGRVLGGGPAAHRGARGARAGDREHGVRGVGRERGGPARPKKNGKANIQNDSTRQPPVDPPPPTRSAAEMLLNKFPDFDPSWDDEIKKKWFESFSSLRGHMLGS